MSGVGTGAFEMPPHDRWDPQTKVVMGLILLILAPIQPFIPAAILGEHAEFAIWWLILGGSIGTPVMLLSALWAFKSALFTRNRPRSR